MLLALVGFGRIGKVGVVLALDYELGIDSVAAGNELGVLNERGVRAKLVLFFKVGKALTH